MNVYPSLYPSKAVRGGMNYTENIRAHGGRTLICEVVRVKLKPRTRGPDGSRTRVQNYY